MKWRMLLFAAGIAVLSACHGMRLEGFADGGVLAPGGGNVVVKAASLPLVDTGRIKPALDKAGVIGGLALDAWIAVYSDNRTHALAVAACAVLPDNWRWSGDGMPPFTVNGGMQMIGGEAFSAGTYVRSGRYDAFAPLVSEKVEEVRWIVRRFLRKTSDQKKLVLEYREVLPGCGPVGTVHDMISLPDLARFEQRAAEAFALSRPASPEVLREGSLSSGIAVRHLDDSFFGDAVPLEHLFRAD